jgi:DNA-directed RNA polymerase specialized sigma24 family protein
VHDALDGLARHDPEAARVAELRFFVGLTNEEIASQIEKSEATVKRVWTFARAYLYREVRRGQSHRARRTP